MKSVRVAVIGVGSLGQHHARVYAALPGTTLVAVVDRKPVRAQEIAGKYGCQALTDFRQVFGQVEAVSIVVPTVHHHAIAIACLDAGLHVLVEKPMTATLEEADDLIARAGDRRRILQVGHIERFNSALRASLGSVKTPRLIECIRWAPYTPRGTDVDVVLDLMIHDLDVVLSLVENDVQRVEAQALPFLSRTNDVAHARVVFSNGCVAMFSASRISEAKVRQIRVHEPDGFLLVDLLEQTARVGRRVMGSTGAPEIVTELVRGDGQEPLKLELEAFVESVRSGVLPLVSGREGAAAMRLASLILEQIRLGNGQTGQIE